MSDAMIVASSCFNSLLICNPGMQKVLRPKWEYGVLSGQSKLKPLKKMIVKARIVKVNPSTYSSTISTDYPLYELPGASFDQYLEDKPRVIRAMFPDKRRSRQLNEDVWRINMRPIHFLFLTGKPVIDMRVRYKSQGIEYPPGVPNDIKKVLELQIIRWELQGLDDGLKPSHFSLSVNGVLYPDTRGARSRLKGKLEMAVSFNLPAVLSLIPEEVRREVAESVLKRLMESMKDKVNSSLLSDYSSFKREKSSNFV